MVSEQFFTGNPPPQIAPATLVDTVVLRMEGNHRKAATGQVNTEHSSVKYSICNSPVLGLEDAALAH